MSEETNVRLPDPEKDGQILRDDAFWKLRDLPGEPDQVDNAAEAAKALKKAKGKK